MQPVISLDPCLDLSTPSLNIINPALQNGSSSDTQFVSAAPGPSQIVAAPLDVEAQGGVSQSAPVLLNTSPSAVICGGSGPSVVLGTGTDAEVSGAVNFSPSNPLANIQLVKSELVKSILETSGSIVVQTADGGLIRVPSSTILGQTGLTSFVSNQNQVLAATNPLGVGVLTGNSQIQTEANPTAGVLDQTDPGFTQFLTCASGASQSFLVQVTNR